MKLNSTIQRPVYEELTELTKTVEVAEGVMVKMFLFKNLLLI